MFCKHFDILLSNLRYSGVQDLKLPNQIDCSGNRILLYYTLCIQFVRPDLSVLRFQSFYCFRLCRARYRRPFQLHICSASRNRIPNPALSCFSNLEKAFEVGAIRLPLLVRLCFLTYLSML